LILLASHARANAIPQFTLSANVELQSVSTLHWADTDKVATPLQAKAELMSGELIVKEFTLPVKEANHWFALTLINPTNKTLNPSIYVKQAFPNIVNLHYEQAFQDPLQSKWISLFSGADIPLQQRLTWTLSPTFNLSLAPYQEQTYYLEIHSKVKLFRLDIMVGDAKSSNSFDLGHLTILNLFIGSVLTLSLISILMYLTFRDSLYLYYCAYIVSFLLTLIIDNTFDLFLELPATDRSFLYLGYNFVIIFFTLFVGKVLDAKHTMPWFNVILRVSRIAAVALASLTLYDFAFFSYTLHVTLFYSVFVVAVALYVAFHGSTSVRLLAYGMVSFLSGIVIIRLVNIGLLQSNLVTDHAHVLGAFIEMVLFSVVLFKRILATNTDKYKANLALLHLAQETDRARSAFITTVSHELRTPLTSIKGALGLIQAGAFDKAPEKIQPLSAIAYKNTERLHHLIDEILDIEQLQSGMMKFDNSVLDLTALLEESIEINGSYGTQHGVTFVYSGTKEPLFVNGDHSRLIQVMSNLLSNAAKFSSAGGQVEVSVVRYGDNLRVSVKDQGCGIPESARSTLFDKFTQVDSSNQRKRGGSGLGLSIVKRILEAHGGQVDFISELGKGSKFYFDLPELLVRQGE
jgi:signal transduction histidine kinase